MKCFKKSSVCIFIFFFLKLLCISFVFTSHPWVGGLLLVLNIAEFISQIRTKQWFTEIELCCEYIADNVVNITTATTFTVGHKAEFGHFYLLFWLTNVNMATELIFL